MDDLGGFGKARTVGELRQLIRDLPDSMPLYFDRPDNGDLVEVEVTRFGLFTAEANAKGAVDDPISEQFITLRAGDA